MLNDNGFRIEFIQCMVCLHEYDAAPDDPNDSCQCPVCINNNAAAEQGLNDLLDLNTF